MDAALDYEVVQHVGNDQLVPLRPLVTSLHHQHRHALLGVEPGAGLQRLLCLPIDEVDQLADELRQFAYEADAGCLENLSVLLNDLVTGEHKQVRRVRLLDLLDRFLVLPGDFTLSFDLLLALLNTTPHALQGQVELWRHRKRSILLEVVDALDLVCKYGLTHTAQGEDVLEEELP